jgi:hypothetical protein
MPRIEIELNDELFGELQQVLQESREPLSLSEVASQCVECTLAEKKA